MIVALAQAIEERCTEVEAHPFALAATQPPAEELFAAPIYKLQVFIGAQELYIYRVARALAVDAHQAIAWAQAGALTNAARRNASDDSAGARRQCFNGRR